MNWAISKAHDSIGEHGEKLPVKDIQGIGDKYYDTLTGEYKKLGAGGWGHGVNLATSDKETQARNTDKLRLFLKQQKRLREAAKKKLDGDVENN